METKIETVTVEKKRGQLATAEGTFNLVHKVFPINFANLVILSFFAPLFPEIYKLN